MKNSFALSVLLILTGAGCAAAPQFRAPAQPPASSVVPTPPPAAIETSNEPIAGKNLINIKDQKSDKEVKEVLVDRVVISKQGFLVVHADVGGRPGKVLGNSVLLNAGETREVSVRLTAQPGMYWAMLHADNGNGKFSATNDLPVMDDKGKPVMLRFKFFGVPASVSAPKAEVKQEAKTESKTTDEQKTSQFSVALKSFAFVPSSLRVAKGDKVVFVNADPAGHTVTADGGAFSSPLLRQNESFILDTSKLSPGMYAYHCNPHPFMKGTLNVQ